MCHLMGIIYAVDIFWYHYRQSILNLNSDICPEPILLAFVLIGIRDSHQNIENSIPLFHGLGVDTRAIESTYENCIIIVREVISDLLGLCITESNYLLLVF